MSNSNIKLAEVASDTFPLSPYEEGVLKAVAWQDDVTGMVDSTHPNLAVRHDFLEGLEAGHGRNTVLISLPLDLLFEAAGKVEA